MPQYLRRLVSLLLIPCLLAQPGLAGVFSIESSTIPQPQLFSTQALNLPITDAEQILTLRPGEPVHDSPAQLGARYMVLGAGGKQGVAAVYGLIKFGNAAHVTMVDVNAAGGQKAYDHLVGLLGPEARSKLTLKIIAPSKQNEIDKFKATLTPFIEEAQKGPGLDLILSCMPYYFNFPTAELAIQHKIHYADLGGHLEDTFAMRATLHKKAKAAGVALASDLGLAPGSNQWDALYAMKQLDTVRDVLIYCGGLPQTPLGILLYQAAFDWVGIIGNYADGPNTAIVNGERVNLDPFTLRENVLFHGAWDGHTEAATTEGATTIMPWTFEGKVANLIYRTLRYGDHWSKVDTLYRTGWFDQDKKFTFDSPDVSPRQMAEAILQAKGLSLSQLAQEAPETYHLFDELHLLKDTPSAFLEPSITPREMFLRAIDPETRNLKPDLVAMRVIATGEKDGVPTEVELEILDLFDAMTGFSAMSRTTGFSAGVVAVLIAEGKIDLAGHIAAEDLLPWIGHIIEGIEKTGIKIDKVTRTQGQMDVLRGRLISIADQLSQPSPDIENALQALNAVMADPIAPSELKVIRDDFATRSPKGLADLIQELIHRRFNAWVTSSAVSKVIPHAREDVQTLPATLTKNRTADNRSTHSPVKEVRFKRIWPAGLRTAMIIQWENKDPGHSEPYPWLDVAEFDFSSVLLSRVFQSLVREMDLRNFEFQGLKIVPVQGPISVVYKDGHVLHVPAYSNLRKREVYISAAYLKNPETFKETMRHELEHFLSPEKTDGQVTAKAIVDAIYAVFDQMEGPFPKDMASKTARHLLLWIASLFEIGEWTGNALSEILKTAADQLAEAPLPTLLSLLEKEIEQAVDKIVPPQSQTLPAVLKDKTQPGFLAAA